MGIQDKQETVVEIHQTIPHPRKSYRPLSTNPWVLVIYAIFALACLTILQVSLHFGTILHGLERRSIDISVGFAPVLGTRDVRLEQRRNEIQVQPVPITFEISPRAPQNFPTTTTTTTTTSGGTGAPPPKSQLALTSTTVVTTQTTQNPSAPPPKNQLTLTSTPTTIAVTTSTTIEASSAPLSASPSDVVTTSVATATTATQIPSTLPPKSQLSLTTTTRTTLGAPPSGSQMSITSTSTGHSGAPNPSSQLSITSTSASVPPDFAPPPGQQLALSGHLGEREYFLVLYLPKIIAVAMQSAWSVTHAATKLMDPFYQLSSSSGCGAQSSLISEYLVASIGMDTINAVRGFRWSLFLTALVSICVALFVTFTSEALAIEPTAVCVTELSDHQPCNPVWVIKAPIVHVMTALLGLIVPTLIYLAWKTSKRSSGIVSDPSVPANLADLLGHSSLLEDLRSIHPSANKREIQSNLRGSKYGLGLYHNAAGQQRYGIIKFQEQASVIEAQGYTAIPNPSMSTEMKPRLRILIARLLRIGGILVVVVALFAIILAYKLVGEQGSGFNNFLNNNSFGPRFLLSGIAVVISLEFKRLERELRITEPYRQMARSPVKGKNSIMMSMGGTPYSGFFVSLFHGRWFLMCMSLTTMLSELLIIAVSGVPFGTSQTALSYKLSTYISLSLLSAMALMIVWVLCRLASGPNLPRYPNSIVNILLLFCGGNIVGRNISQANDQDDAYNGSLKENHFSLDWLNGFDGRTRWTINQVD